MEDLILNKIIETSNNNITVIDSEGIIVHSNPEHWVNYGMKPGTYKGTSIYDLEKEGLLAPSIGAIVLNEKIKKTILQHTKTDRVIMSTGYPVFDEKEELLFVVSYSHDQTEILELQQQYEKMERKVKGYQTEVEELREKEFEQNGIIARSSAAQHILKTIYNISKTDATVLLLGPSGVGKSTFARILHSHSNRKKEQFIEVNCSTIPEGLFESEIFGYETGAFTGANKQGSEGLIEQADGGTLFLDEIGELPLSMQAKLLKVLQEKKIKRLGGKKERTINFRLVTATNQDLEKMVQEGRFRLDLYYRLNVIPLQIPSLEERKEDISYLVQDCLQKFNSAYNVKKRIHPSTYDVFTNYNWPGNIRELENLMERLILTIEDEVIYPTHLPANFNTFQTNSSFSLDNIEQPLKVTNNLKEILENTEIQIILKALKKCKTTYEMATYLGISQPTVIYKLKKYKNKLDHS
ncbi:sigma-54 interaction domain-containing protein [Psychrobacillus soli]|uniref:HTH-type transcriptional regulatory protein TyrR n=1 Tax=Psychrobacillus soli TaxID=1543965 RepID=A0A544TFC0_9BACI|nr:sigma 54-interacting transcriptional regulator [Psychrobacillus soli]TQR16157.1 AAA family ATPase [Psychrobacillus soli]